ncbi:MAG: hypothetical protein LBJ97_00280 [Mycoplasmataceae bacterium]|nr:hypothetical protein [Mycoplasmataceae bacterium]
MTIKQDKTDKNSLSEQQTEMLKDIDFSTIPSSDEFQKIKVKPQNRWFNSVMALVVIAIGTCVGVTIGMIVSHFA